MNKVHPQIISTIVCCLITVLFTSCSTPGEPSIEIHSSATLNESISTEKPVISSPTETETVQATETHTATYTKSPSPTITHAYIRDALSVDGPWVVFVEDSGLWVVNHDGSGLTQLVTFPSYIIYRFSYDVSHVGGMITFNDPVDQFGGIEPYTPDLQSSPSLNIIDLPATDSRLVTPLMEPSQIRYIATQYPSFFDTSEENSSFYHVEQIKAAISRPDSLAWSPLGDKLAFSAALDGPTTDLYVFDMNTDAISRLSSGGTQAVDLEWSSDGRYIVHKAVSDINLGDRSGPQLIIEGIWSAAVNGSGLELLMQGDSEVVGWISDSEILLHKWDYDCWKYQLSVVNIRTGKSRIIWPGPFEYAVSDPESGTVMIGHGYPETRSFPDSVCPSTHPSGIYLISGSGGDVERVSDWQQDNGYPPRRYPRFVWSAEWNSFILFQMGEVVFITPDGEVQVSEFQSEIPPMKSPSGQLIIELREYSIRIIGEGMDDVAISGAFCNFLWGIDDQTLVLSSDNNLYIAKAPDYQLFEIPEQFSGLCDSNLELIQP